jgi:hypothetical protein
MSKQFINELSRMKDLFGYKKGQVISEQSFSKLTPKQIEAQDAGWGPVTDEFAKTLPVDSRGKIIPKQIEKESDKPLGRGQGAGSIYSGEYKFVKFPCLNPEWKQVKIYDNQQKTDGKVTIYLQGEGNDKDKVGNKLSEILFSENGEYYVRGQRTGKFSCNGKGEILLDDVPMIKDIKPKVLPNVTVYTIPKDLKNVKEFQDCMDRLHSGWYKGSNLNKGPGYGKFGPNTSKAWGKYKKDYLTGACSKPNVDKDIKDYPINKFMTGTKDFPGAFNVVEPPIED